MISRVSSLIHKFTDRKAKSNSGEEALRYVLDMIEYQKAMTQVDIHNAKTEENRNREMGVWDGLEQAQRIVRFSLGERIDEGLVSFD